MYLVACDFVKTESILKLCLIFNLSKIQFRQCELWGRPPPLLEKVHILNFFFLEGFPKHTNPLTYTQFKKITNSTTSTN